jgi:hypothetical protein
MIFNRKNNEFVVLIIAGTLVLSVQADFQTDADWCADKFELYKCEFDTSCDGDSQDFYTRSSANDDAIIATIEASSLFQTCNALTTSTDCLDSSSSCTWISGISFPTESNGCRPFSFTIPGILSDAGVPTAQSSTWYYTYHEHGTSVETQLCMSYSDESTCNARLECQWQSDDSECWLAGEYTITEVASACPTQDFNAITTQEYSETLASLYSKYDGKVRIPNCASDYYVKDAHCSPCPENSNKDGEDSVVSTFSLTCRCKENFKPVDGQCVACPDGTSGPDAAGRLLENDSYESSCVSTSTTPTAPASSSAAQSIKVFTLAAAVGISLMLAY